MRCRASTTCSSRWEPEKRAWSASVARSGLDHRVDAASARLITSDPAGARDRLPRAPARQQDAGGAHQDREVEPEAPLVDVLQIERHPLRETEIVAPAHLP